MFGSDGVYPLGRVGDDGQALAATMQQMWTRFAADGDPGADWPRYEEAADRYQTLDVPLSTGTALKAAQCQFWDTLLL